MPSSMSLNATPSRPISVLGSDSSTRRSRSPRAMSSAAVAIDSSGRSSRRITRLAVAPSRISRPAVTSSSTRITRLEGLVDVVQRHPGHQVAAAAVVDA